VHTILVPLDDAAPSRRVLPFAARVARGTGATLVLLQVVPDEGLGDHAHAVLASAAQQCASAGLSVRCELRVGTAAACIVDAARDLSADLVAMSTHRWSDMDRWLNGSVVDEVLRQSDMPVLVLPPGLDHTWSAHRPLRVLVALDGSPLAEAVLEPLTHLAASLPTTLILARVDHVEQTADYLAQVAQRLEPTGLPVDVRAAPASDVPRALVDLARTEEADLIALATHGRSGLSRLLVESHVPLFLARPACVPQPSPPVHATA
jgi:nucleotide-binding universal stress UspA family protein